MKRLLEGTLCHDTVDGGISLSCVYFSHVEKNKQEIIGFAVRFNVENIQQLDHSLVITSEEFPNPIQICFGDLATLFPEVFCGRYGGLRICCRVLLQSMDRITGTCNIMPWNSKNYDLRPRKLPYLSDMVTFHSSYNVHHLYVVILCLKILKPLNVNPVFQLGACIS